MVIEISGFCFRGDNHTLMKYLNSYIIGDID